MKYLDLQTQLSQNIFTIGDVAKVFPTEPETSLKTQLARFAQKGLIKSIKRGIYTYDLTKIDELELAEILYQPSYISLETALHHYGMIPDIPQTTTSVTPVITKTIDTPVGAYTYAKIAQDLFFGYKSVKSPQSHGYFPLAEQEKALLDFFYIRKITRVDELRLDTSSLDRDRYKIYAQYFPNWVQSIQIS
jgi:predicted transcriptional regulator of viral defense system